MEATMRLHRCCDEAEEAGLGRVSQDEAKRSRDETELGRGWSLISRCEAVWQAAVKTG